MFFNQFKFVSLISVVFYANVCLSFKFPIGLVSKAVAKVNHLFHFGVKNETVLERSAIVLIANGTEELEAVTIIDLLRRSKMRVVVAGVEGPDAVTCKFGCVLIPDTDLASALLQPLFDLIVIPGGEEACNTMAQSEQVGTILSRHVKGERFVGATTSGPVVLDAHKINYLRRLTSAPEYYSKLRNHYSHCNSLAGCETIVDSLGHMVTGRYTGTILEFGLTLVNHVLDRKTAESISFDLHPFYTT